MPRPVHMNVSEIKEIIEEHYEIMNTKYCYVCYMIDKDNGYCSWRKIEKIESQRRGKHK